MTEILSSHCAFRRERPPAVWAVAILLVLGQFTFLLALQPLAGVGIWFQSEPVSAANAGIAGMVLAVLALRRKGPSLPPLAVTVILAIAAWSVISLPFAASWVESWLGTPQSGHGIGWLLTVAAYALGANALRRHRGALSLVTIAMSAGAFTLTALNNWAPAEWRPQSFTDVAAFNALFAWIAIMAWKPGRPAVSVIAALGLLGLIALSDNRSSYVAVLAGGAVMAVGAWAVRRPFGRWFLAALPVLAAISLTAAILVLGRYDLLRSIQHGLRDTIISRANMIRVVGEEMKAEPAMLLFGHGWGGFDVALSRSMALETVALQPLGDNEFLYWDAAHRNDFHTHNEVIEAALSAGLPAALAFPVFFGMLVYGAPRRVRVPAAGFAVALAVLSCMWFQLPSSIPVFGAAIGLIGVGRSRSGSRLSGVLRPALCSACVLLAATSVALWVRADAGRKEFAAIPSGDCSPLLAGQARIHSVWLIQAQWHRLTAALEAGGAAEIATEAENMRRRLCSADAMAQARDGLPLAVEAAIIRTDLAALQWPESARELRSEILAPIKEGLARTLKAAPKRGDLAVPYLSLLLAAGREGDVLDFVTRNLPPDDPVGLWYAGAVLLGSPDKFTVGMKMMQRSMHLGVERFVVVPPELKRQIIDFK